MKGQIPPIEVFFKTANKRPGRRCLAWQTSKFDSSFEGPEHDMALS